MLYSEIHPGAVFYTVPPPSGTESTQLRHLFIVCSKALEIPLSCFSPYGERIYPKGESCHLLVNLSTATNSSRRDPRRNITLLSRGCGPQAVTHDSCVCYEHAFLLGAAEITERCFHWQRALPDLTHRSLGEVLRGFDRAHIQGALTENVMEFWRVYHDVCLNLKDLHLQKS
ncbi:MAG: hypothetical protein IJ228_06675 [Succinivibrio sp.]|nr:hypothetical protein [Succinivibrio sp.]